MYIIAIYLQFSVCVLKHHLPVFMVSFNHMLLQKLEYTSVCWVFYETNQHCHVVDTTVVT